MFGYKKKSVYPLRNSDCTDRENNIMLLLIEKDGLKHYCLVKDLSRLLASQMPRTKGKHYFCLRCFNPFWFQQSLNKHQEYCNEHEAVKVELPKEGKVLSLKTISDRKRFLSLFTLISSLTLSRQIRAVLT